MTASPADATDDKPHYHSHALSRGLELLQVVANASGVATLTEMHESTGYPKSTLVRLLSVLEAEGYLVRVDERPAYKLGHSLLPIAVGYLDSGTVADLFRPALARLAASTGWTANIGVIDGKDVLHVCVEFPDRPIHYTAFEGARSAAYCTGLGKAILSEFGADEVSAAMPAEPYARRTKHTITTLEEMLTDLRAAKERGYAIDAEEADLGLRCIAVPLIWEHGVLGAVSVSGPSGEADPAAEAAFLESLLETRERIVAKPELASALRLTFKDEAARTRTGAISG